MRITVKIVPCFIALVASSFAALAQIQIQDDPTYGDFDLKHRNTRKSAATLNSNPLLKDYDITFYGLDVEVDNKSDQINGNVTILAKVRNNPLSTMVVELYNTLTVDRILVDGEEQQFTHEGNEININLGSTLDTGSMLTAQIFYGGQTGEGMVNEPDGDWDFPVTYTSSEPFYSKDWFPCKENLEDKADSLHVFITTDYGLKGVSNGLLTGTTYFPNGKVRYEWKSNYPIAFYLIGISVADYIEYNIEAQPTGIRKPIPIQNFLYDHPDALELYRDQINVTTAIMDLFCEYFGPYPHREEKYGHYMWPRGGGMEHQTMTGMGNFEFYLVAHELGHSWFGNYVTCATWQDIWINEGFATFAGYFATEKLGPEFARGERDYRFESAMRVTDGSVYVPAAQKDDDSRIFSGSLSYNKGMALLYMMRYELEDDASFFLTLRNFLSRYANDVASGLEFKQVLEETTGKDFTDFFNQWYFGAGYPIFGLEWKQQGQTVTLNSTQTTSSALTTLFKMPLEYRIYYPGGDTTVRVYQLANKKTFIFSVDQPIDSIQIDPDNHVLNGVAGVSQLSGKKSKTELFSLYPNPTRGPVNFTFEGEGIDHPSGEQAADVTVEVYDASSRLVSNRRYEGCLPYMTYSIDMEHLSAGLYFISFESNRSIEIKKVLVK